jgi:malate/lactate dehydrogenase
MRNSRFATVEDAGQIRADDAVPFIVRHVGNRAADTDAGVVDEHIQLAEPGHDLSYCALHGGGITHIARDSCHLIGAAAGGELLLRLLRSGLGPAADRHAIAVREQHSRNRKTNTACASRHEADSIHADRIVRVPTAVIIGAGDVGGALARQLAAIDVVSNLTLVDEAGDVAHGKALDIRQAAPIDRYSTVVSGATALDVVIGAAVVVIADRGDAHGEWRDDAGAGLIGQITRLNAAAPIICAGAMQASLVERAVRELGVARSRVFGTAPEALRSAVAAIAALEAGCATTDIGLTVLGRPPDQIVVPWEDASIAGQRATAILTPQAVTRLDARLPRLWPPGPFTLASAATRAVHAALSRAPRPLCAFVSVTREEGVLGNVGMLPVTLSPKGIASVTTPALSTRDRIRLESALSMQK